MFIASILAPSKHKRNGFRDLEGGRSAVSMYLIFCKGAFVSPSEWRISGVKFASGSRSVWVCESPVKIVCFSLFCLFVFFSFIHSFLLSSIAVFGGYGTVTANDCCSSPSVPKNTNAKASRGYGAGVSEHSTI